MIERMYSWVDQGAAPQTGLVQGSDGYLYGTTYTGGGYDCGTVFRISTAGEVTLLHSFTGTDGANPSANAELVQGDDGYFYGTTYAGGVYGYGVIFRISTEGEYKVLHSFVSSDGRRPAAGLVQGSDGYFYGTTSYGGVNDYGTVFRISAAGDHQVLYSLTNASGSYPRAGLVQGSDGYFYGTASNGGANGSGTVFRISATGDFKTLYAFTYASGDEPRAALVQGSDGYFYGTAAYGGASGNGTVFRISAAGEYAVLRSFTTADGTHPYAGLELSSDGNFYGTTSYGGANGKGTVFRISAAGKYAVLRSFDRTNVQNHLCSKLVQGSDGEFYGAISSGSNEPGAIFRISAAGKYAQLHSFDRTAGSHPYAGLLQGSDDYFYGTTYSGGLNNNGTVFRISAAGEYTVLHSFNGTDGSNPSAGLVQGSDGAFYGTTYSGGTGRYGTVFRISAAGEYTVLHSFYGSYVDGGNPRARLVQGSDGCFYGTTSIGGASSNGVIFKISAAGEYTVLYPFTYASGGNPGAGLVLGSDGYFYGTTSSGGANGRGTVFRISATGEYATLYSFTYTDGYNPYAELIQGSDGCFYGTTSSGGWSGYGTVFRISASGEFKVLHSFAYNDGSAPTEKLVQGIDGYFYGTTASGGAGGYGTVFRVGTEGEFKTIYSFTSTTGSNPSAELVQGRDGNLWGTTCRDKISGGGTIYRLLFEPVTLPADRITYSSGVIHARVSRGSGTTVQFEYDVDPTLSTPAHTDLAPFPDGTDAVIVSAGISNLLPGTTYYYRARVVRADDLTLSGEILSFTTGLDEPQTTVLATKGAAVPGAGNPGSGIPSGAVWQLFGVPASGGTSKFAFSASLKLTTGIPLTGIFAGESDAPMLIAKRGGMAPGISSASVFSSFKAPLINRVGEIAFIGYATGGWLPSKGSQGIWSNAGIPSGKPEWLVALQGIQAADAPYGATWKAFRSVALSDSGAVSFTATLEQGRGGVTPANDFGLWQATLSGTRLLLREGQGLVLDGVTHRVKNFVALPATSSEIPVRVTFSDNTQALLKFSADSEPEIIAASGDAVSDADGAFFCSFGMPALNAVGTTAVNATLARGTANVDVSNDCGIFLSRDNSWSVIARKGSVAPGGLIVKGWSARFTSFSDPLINSEGQVAFLGTATGAVQGIWWSGAQGSDLQLVASTASSTVPGLSGARFTTFRSLALPDGELAGPVFVAKVEGMGINSSNDVGLWAVDSEGVLRLIVREGHVIEGKVLRSFTVLSTVAGSSARLHSYNAAGRQLLYRAFFTDGSQSLITVRVP